MRVRSLLVAFLCVGMLAAPAAAQQKMSPAQIEQARRHYGNATTAEKAGRYDEAVSEFIAAYEIMKDPKLFFQIGKTYEKGGKKDEALIYYRRYLKEATVSDQGRADLKAHMAELEGKAPAPSPPAATKPAPTPPAATKPAPKPAPTPPAATTTTPGPGDEILPPPVEPKEGELKAGEAQPAPPPPSVPMGAAPPAFPDEGTAWQRTAAWISVGVTAAFATTGAVLASSASSREEDVDRLVTFHGNDGLPTVYQGEVKDQYEDAVDEGDSFNTYAKVAFIGAGAAAVAAITFFILDATRPVESGGSVAITPQLGPDGAGIGAAWEF